MNKPTPQHIKDEIYRVTAKQFAEWYPPETQHPGGHCVAWACTGLRILMERGFNAKLQAGSMSWPIVTAELDDGVSPTHFTYEWSPHTPKSQGRMAAGGIPEMHVWLALPDRNEIIDFSTKFFLEQAKQFDLVWQAPAPPDYLWAGAEDLRRINQVRHLGVYYQANMEAITYIINYLRQKAGARTVRLKQITRK
jgi:hypothetical protein